MRETIFISHAAPDDNDFTRWLSLQLIGLGYHVWSDVIKLKGGEDWWKFIEPEIRDNTIKFLYVLSTASNSKEGALNELAIARKAKRALGDEQFIIPLNVDKNLPNHEVNIELGRLNSISFKHSWANGLNILLELFEEHNVPKGNQNFQAVKELWNSVILQNQTVITKKEIYSSNWFPITELPSVLKFHKFGYAILKGFIVRDLTYPGVVYKDYLATFAWFDEFLDKLPATINYHPSNTIQILTKEILEDDFDSRFIRTKEAKNIIVQLLNNSFDKSIARKPVSTYPMSNKTSFWIKKGVIEKDKFQRVLLIGKQKEKQWHFGISGSAKLFPERCFVINAHI